MEEGDEASERIVVRRTPADIECQPSPSSLEKLHHSELRDALVILPRASHRPPSHLSTFQGTGLLRALDEISSHPRRPDPRAKSAESSTFNPDVGRYLGVLDELYNPRKCRDGEKGGRRGAPR